jgi:Uncharacterized protein conserved in bacteria
MDGEHISNECDPMLEMKREFQRNMLHRLRRVEGQLRGVQRMIEAEARCEELAQQLAASRKALDRAFFEMVACTMEMELHTGVGQSADTEAEAGSKAARILAKYA